MKILYNKLTVFTGCDCFTIQVFYEYDIVFHNQSTQKFIFLNLNEHNLNKFGVGA